MQIVLIIFLKLRKSHWWYQWCGRARKYWRLHVSCNLKRRKHDWWWYRPISAISWSSFCQHCIIRLERWCEWNRWCEHTRCSNFHSWRSWLYCGHHRINRPVGNPKPDQRKYWSSLRNWLLGSCTTCAFWSDPISVGSQLNGLSDALICWQCPSWQCRSDLQRIWKRGWRSRRWSNWPKHPDCVSNSQ